MAKKLDASIKYTIFDRVRFEMLNWTGYDAQLLEELIESGNTLIRENESLRRRKPIDWDALKTTIGAGALLAFFTTLALLLLGFLIRNDIIEQRMGVAYKAGQIDALTAENIVYVQTSRGFTLDKGIQVRHSFYYNGKSYSFYYEK